MAHPVVHWEITGKAGTELQDFYASLFDWQVQPMDMGSMTYGMVNTGGEGGINGGICAAMDGAPPYLTVYVQVDDLEAHLKKAEDLGAKTVHPPTPIPNVGAIAMFTDPAGNMVGLFKPGG